MAKVDITGMAQNGELVDRIWQACLAICSTTDLRKKERLWNIKHKQWDTAGVPPQGQISTV